MILASLEKLLANPETASLLYSALLTFTRLYVILAFFPGLGGMQMPYQVRVMMAAAWSFQFFPTPENRAIFSSFPMDLMFGFGHEILVGLLLGLILKLAVLALEIAGELIAQISGFNNILGMTASQNNPLIPQMLSLLGALVLLFPEHLQHLFYMIETSFLYFPFHGSLTDQLDRLPILAIIKTAFEQSFVFAAPFVLFFSGYNLMLGFINRAFPSLMITFIAAPFSIFLCMIMMWVFFPLFLPDFVAQTLLSSLSIWETLGE